MDDLHSRTMPEISVVIPTYNRERYLAAAVKSVLSQTYSDYEIIVIDDGSTDGTYDLVKSLPGPIHYVYQPNAGVSAARNRGGEEAKGKWLAFLDSDDEWLPGYLSRQMEYARRTSGLCMQIADCRFVGLDGKSESYFSINKSLPLFYGRDYCLLEDGFSFIVKHAPWQIGSAIIRREMLHKAGGFDPRLKISEDLDLIARVSLSGLTGFLNEALVNVFRRNENLCSLTTSAGKNPIEIRKINGMVYEKLSRIEGLSKKQRKCVKSASSANNRAMGNLLKQSGDVRLSRMYYRQAMQDQLTMKSIARYLLSFRF